MPITPTYPGLYVQEIPSGVRTIVSASTSVTAFIGRALRGPVDEPIVCNNFGDFNSKFGGIWAESSMSYAVRDFFANGGSQAVIVRLFRPDFESEDARKVRLDAAKGIAGPAVDAVNVAVTAAVGEGAKALVSAARTKATEYAGSSVEEMTAARHVVVIAEEEILKAPSASDAKTSISDAVKGVTDTAEAIKQGLIDMLAAVAASTNDTSNPDKIRDVARDVVDKVLDAAAKDALTAVMEELDSADPVLTTKIHVRDALLAKQGTLDPEQDAIIVAANLVKDAATGAANELDKIREAATEEITAQSAASPSIESALAGLPSAVAKAIAPPPRDATIKTRVTARKQEAVDAGAGAAAPLDKAVLKVGGLELQAKYAGKWGSELRARITTEVEDEDDTKAFNLYVRDGSTGRIEAFLGVSVDSKDARDVIEVVKTESKLVEVLKPVPLVPIASEPSNAKGVVADRFAWEDANSSGVIGVGVAGDGKVLVQADYTGNETQKTGLWALEDVEIFNLLCVPPYELDSKFDQDLVTKAIKYCEKRRAFMIVDPPLDWVDKESAKKGINEPAFTKSDHAAVFFPRLKMRDPARGDRLAKFVPCGAIAGLFARIDTARGTWKAPAGLNATINGVSELAVNLSDEEQGELNPLGLNCMRAFPTGFTNWGARTLKGSDKFASEYKYIPVRRMALLIENSLFMGLKWVVFEPNDEPLWAQIRLNVGSYMHGLFRQGAFEGSTPKDAYFVKCDGETTTATDRNLGIVNILVGFAPLKPAEFVIISLQQMTRKEE